MARIKIGDIPRNRKINREEMKRIVGGSGNLDGEIKNWDEQLNTLGDDAQLANIDLQSALQRQQQTLQVLSNVSKMMHDTQMGSIRKIG